MTIELKKRPNQSHWKGVAGATAVGVLGGVAAKAADSGVSDWLSDLANYPAAYVLGLVLISRFAPTAAQAALRSAAFFVSFCLGYYGWAQYGQGFGGSRYFVIWTALALTAVPSFAVLLWWAARRAGLLPGLVIALAAAIVLADGPVRQVWLRYVTGDLPPNFPVHPSQAVFDIIAAGVIVGLTPQHLRTRVVAVLCIIPMYLLATQAIDALRSSLGI